jgi:uncharacterized membrane protein
MQSMELNGTVFIARPASEVYRYVMDVSNDKNWREGVDESGFRSGGSFSPGSIGYTRAGNVEVEWKILSSRPGESVDWELLSGPYKGFGGYRFQPIGNGTQFTLVSDVRPTGLYRLLGPIFAMMGRRQNQADVERLREVLEEGDQYRL